MVVEMDLTSQVILELKQKQCKNMVIGTYDSTLNFWWSYIGVKLTSGHRLTQLQLGIREKVMRMESTRCNIDHITQ